MKQTVDILFDPAASPECDQCRGPTSLIGIEPHWEFDDTDLHTYECTQCGHMQARSVRLEARPKPVRRIFSQA
jgi:hypothetical protein